MTTTPWTEYKDGSTKYRIRAKYGWQVIGGQEAYWSITCETQRWNGYWAEDSFGPLDEKRAEEHFPQLAPTLRWHLTFEKSGPLHYIPNAVHWFQYLAGCSHWEPTHADPVECFKSTVIFGAVEGDEMPKIPVRPADPPKSTEFIHDDAKEIRRKALQDYRNTVTAEVESWCRVRFAKLLIAMNRDLAPFRLDSVT